MNNPELKDKNREPETCEELIDCGSVSQSTRGLPNLIFFEVGSPPNDRYFEDW